MPYNGTNCEASMTLTEKILETHYANPRFNRTEFARKNNIETSFIRKVIRKSKRGVIEQGCKPLEEKIDFNNTSRGNAKLDIESTTISTLPQALEIAQVDLTTWKVDRYTIGSWQVTLKIRVPTKEKNQKGDIVYREEPKTITMFKIQVWLKRLENIEFVEAIRNLIKEIPKLKTPKKKYNRKGDYLLEIALFDIHFGMLAWKPESGNDYDIKIAENIFLLAVQDLLDKTTIYKPSRILFPIGSDFLHVDDPTNSTPQNKNPLDTDSRLIKIYEKAKKATIKAVNYCREFAPVDIVWIPGNHDPQISWYLCDVLGEVFSKDKDVTVDVAPTVRKYFSWGKSLIVFTHGSEEKHQDLPGIIATEKPALWGNSIYREVHTGHRHRKSEMKWINIEEKSGAIVRVIPSLVVPDAWHMRKGYVRGWHSAEAYLWDKKWGVIAQFTTFANHEGIKNNGSKN